MSERDFWMVVRSALIMIIRAIERRYLAGAETRTPAPTYAQPGSD